MNIEAQFCIVTLVFTLLGLIMKILDEMKQNIKDGIIAHARIEGKLNLIEHRLDSAEQSLNKLDATADELIGYMSSTSDFQQRKY
jgi:hypothetical protein